mmetsp:Transcript_7932/g.12266  ORF Transcript_7932/g.12266 Transcript_7932/m.12266 type:complete len:148 (-) Transcript_7932:50-493(-)
MEVKADPLESDAIYKQSTFMPQLTKIVKSLGLGIDYKGMVLTYLDNLKSSQSQYIEGYLRNFRALQIAITHEMKKIGFDELVINAFKKGSTLEPQANNIDEIELTYTVTPVQIIEPYIEPPQRVNKSGSFLTSSLLVIAVMLCSMFV